MNHMAQPPLDAGPRLGRLGRWRFHPSALAPYSLPFFFVAMVVVFSLLRPDTFATAANWRATSQSVSTNTIVALALLVPLVAGRFDLSVGSNVGLTSVIAGTQMADHGFALLPALIVAVLVGTVVGSINGLFIAYLRVDSLVVTLGTATILVGITTWRGGGEIISSGLSSHLTALGTDRILGIPVTFLIAMAFAVAVWYLITQTLFGRNLSAIGSNEQSATLVGIKVRRTIFASFIISGILGSLAGMLLIANQGNANPSVGGINFMLPALAGVFLGVSAFTPGKYNVPGTVVGLLFVAGTISGLALLGVAPWVEPVFNGSAVVLAVTLSTFLGRSGHEG